jgi:BirA family transcriptional regulator, biotin operon repressor / biotin---[acetyl-CoA-carboxylase] ligase
MRMANTLFVGKVYHRFDELPSTNDWAAALLAQAENVATSATKNKPPEGTAVRAASQSAGRGQFGSRWESTAGQNLLLSVLFYPHWLAASSQFGLSMAVALALRDTINACAPHSAVRATVKWPNDLYLGSRKVAGILIQNSLAGQHLQSSIVGIGLNVNQLRFSPDLPNPTSMALAFGQEYALDAVADTLFEHLERRYLQLKAGREGDLKAEYESHLYRLGVSAQFARSADGAVFEGIIQGVTALGWLRIKVGEAEEAFEVKGVKFL